MRNRLVMFPGAHYSNPELTWKFEVAPAAIGFVDGRGLGKDTRMTCSWAARG